MGLFGIIGICMLFGFVFMAFWCLIFVFSTVGGWAALGARELFVKAIGHKLGMKRNYAPEDEA